MISGRPFLTTLVYAAAVWIALAGVSLWLSALLLSVQAAWLVILVSHPNYRVARHTWARSKRPVVTPPVFALRKVGGLSHVPNYIYGTGTWDKHGR